MNAVLPPAPPRGRAPGRVQFLLLATLFVTPFLCAWLLFQFPGTRPEGTTNYGELQLPVREVPKWEWSQIDGKPADADLLKGKWTVLQIAGAACDQACADRIFMTRQVRTALNAERDRVQRVVLSSDAAGMAALQTRFAPEHPDLLWRATSDLDKVTAFLGQHDAQALYVIDPLGNYVMLYPGGRPTQVDFKGMQKDLLKLLKQSRIG